MLQYHLKDVYQNSLDCCLSGLWTLCDVTHLDARAGQSRDGLGSRHTDRLFDVVLKSIQNLFFLILITFVKMIINLASISETKTFYLSNEH
jgi:hypothetical protein